MFEGKRVSVVVPAFNEEQGIGKTIQEFYKPFVDEIIVVDNNSTDKTAQISSKHKKVKVVLETNQGYGFSIQRGLREATGELIFVTEADNTFSGQDMNKMLELIGRYDLVLGTRTAREFIEEGAKMNWFLWLGNVFLGKLIQLKFWGKTSLTDVGCTFRLIKKPALKKIQKHFTVGKSHFSPEMIILSLRHGLKVKEIPVHYRMRLGDSKITSNYFKSFKLGLIMIKLILTR